MSKRIHDSVIHHLATDSVAGTTERNALEEALARREALLNEVQKVSHVGGWEYDIPTRHLTWTEEVYRIHELPREYDPNDIADDLQFYAGDDRSRIATAFNRAITVGEPYDLELQFVTAKGTRLWVRTVGQPELKDGHPIRVVGNIADITERKRIEASLQEAKATAERYLDVAAEVILALDAHGIITLLNASGHRLLGYAPGELVGRSWFETCLPTEVQTEVRGVFARLMAGQFADVMTYENTVVTKSGSKLYLLWHNTLLRDADGRIAGALSSAEDITDRKQAEEKLRASAADLRQAQALAHVGSWRWDVAHDQLTWSDEMYRIFGVSPHAFTGKWHDVVAHCVHPDDRVRVERENRAVLEDHNPPPIEYRVIWPDGSIRTVWDQTGEVTLNDNGQVSVLKGVVLDTTERTQAEEKIRLSEADLRKAQQVAHVGSWRWDIVNDSLIWSDEMYQIFGIPKCEFNGSLQSVIARAIHPDDRSSVEAANRSVAEQSKPQPLEYRIIWPDGSVRTVWAEAGEMTLGANGHASSLTGIVVDITDRKNAEAERQLMQEQLLQLQKMEAIGQLAGGIAHDFNNLLTGVIGNIAIVRSDLPATSPLIANLNAAETAARQATDLAKGLLTFSRKAVVSAIPVNVADILDATLVILKQSLPATMNIVRDVDQTGWSVLADQSQIAQAILNLVLNARDAMQGNGTCTISIRDVRVNEDYVRTHSFARTGEFVKLSVADTGPGIPDEIRDHLFEPFFTTKPAGSGTGLGLSIVYGAVKQAGGWIIADSPAGAGAVFDIYLPRCLSEPSARTPVSRSAVAQCAGMVLIAEDEPVVSAVAQALLKRSGLNVLVAGDGASALGVLREYSGKIDLILLDMTMPGMTTDDIVDAIRDIDARVPILLTSGYASGETVNDLLAAGTVQGFLAKPYELRDFMESVGGLLARKPS